MLRILNPSSPPEWDYLALNHSIERAPATRHGRNGETFLPNNAFCSSLNPTPSVSCSSYKSCIHFISTALCKIEIFGRKFPKWAGPPLILWVTQRGQKLLCDRTWNVSKCINFNRLVVFFVSCLAVLLLFDSASSRKYLKTRSNRLGKLAI